LEFGKTGKKSDPVKLHKNLYLEITILLHVIPTRYSIHRVNFYLTLLYMFWALLSPIVRSTKNCNYSIW